MKTVLLLGLDFMQIRSIIGTGTVGDILAMKPCIGRGKGNCFRHRSQAHLHGVRVSGRGDFHAPGIRRRRPRLLYLGLGRCGQVQLQAVSGVAHLRSESWRVRWGMDLRLGNPQLGQQLRQRGRLAADVRALLRPGRAQALRVRQERLIPTTTRAAGSAHPSPALPSGMLWEVAKRSPELCV